MTREQSTQFRHLWTKEAECAFLCCSTLILGKHDSTQLPSDWMYASILSPPDLLHDYGGTSNRTKS